MYPTWLRGSWISWSRRVSSTDQYSFTTSQILVSKWSALFMWKNRTWSNKSFQIIPDSYRSDGVPRHRQGREGGGDHSGHQGSRDGLLSGAEAGDHGGEVCVVLKDLNLHMIIKWSTYLQSFPSHQSCREVFQIIFREFPCPAWAEPCCSSGPQAGGTP